METAKLISRRELPHSWASAFKATAHEVADKLLDRALAARFCGLIQEIRLLRYDSVEPVSMGAIYLPSEREVLFLESAFNGIDHRFQNVAECFEWITLHELSHILDHASDYVLSDRFGREVGSSFGEKNAAVQYIPGNRDGLTYATTICGSKSLFEDFAESVAIYLSRGVYMRGTFGQVDRARLVACSRLFRAEE